MFKDHSWKNKVNSHLNGIKSNLYIGIMSGTSVDGIDVVLSKIQHNSTVLVGGTSCSFDESLRTEILLLCQTARCELITLGQLEVKLTKSYAKAVQQLLANYQLEPCQIRAIGCHGQTVLHHPFGDHPFSMQLVNANVLAAETGITCVTGFRGMDIAFQGQGAPLVPMFHQSLFENTVPSANSDPSKNRVLLNLGGIANLTLISEKVLKGFDTGPCNTLLDSWMQTKCSQPYDKNGELALSGKVNKSLLSILLADHYFSQPHPKSTGREYFNLAWFNQKLEQFESIHSQSLSHPLSNADIMATLVQLSAVSITNELNQALSQEKSRELNQELKQQASGSLLVFGGGTQNIALMNALSRLLPLWHIETTDSIGIESQYMEALAFAWLSYRCITGQVANAPSVTGATQATILGQITQVTRQKLVLGE
ncbi:anhydro-N-acetylmuramic acid kinase [Colwellia sp. RSH04]|uniref:anhydro-N-acetylmuramic acid kinase n=1 Tax=Colwellia sp. RSH04 TaxID=2305464 RepID=UPI000E581163|nr:anhydro-N-acetylmuramic acid kinase [Colwellia sp. RSH04]RHW76493.1 anhydro-N-acetylmuramic acid kinase [Colwellia sp. RSH04]